MISTVTTSTVTSITSVTSIGFGVTLGVIAVIALFGFLCVRELASASERGSARLLVKSLDVGIAPLVVAFAVIVIAKVLEVLT